MIIVIGSNNVLNFSRVNELYSVLHSHRRPFLFLFLAIKSVRVITMWMASDVMKLI